MEISKSITMSLTKKNKQNYILKSADDILQLSFYECYYLSFTPKTPPKIPCISLEIRKNI